MKQERLTIGDGAGIFRIVELEDARLVLEAIPYLRELSRKTGSSHLDPAKLVEDLGVAMRSIVYLYEHPPEPPTRRSEEQTL